MTGGVVQNYVAAPPEYEYRGSPPAYEDRDEYEPSPKQNTIPNRQKDSQMNISSQPMMPARQNSSDRVIRIAKPIEFRARNNERRKKKSYQNRTKSKKAQKAGINLLPLPQPEEENDERDIQPDYRPNVSKTSKVNAQVHVSMPGMLGFHKEIDEFDEPGIVDERASRREIVRSMESSLMFLIPQPEVKKEVVKVSKGWFSCGCLSSSSASDGNIEKIHFINIEDVLFDIFRNASLLTVLLEYSDLETVGAVACAYKNSACAIAQSVGYAGGFAGDFDFSLDKQIRTAVFWGYDEVFIYSENLRIIQYQGDEAKIVASINAFEVNYGDQLVKMGLKYWEIYASMLTWDKREHKAYNIDHGWFKNFGGKCTLKKSALAKLVRVPLRVLQGRKVYYPLWGNCEFQVGRTGHRINESSYKSSRV